jgi:hypothetical protein
MVSVRASHPGAPRFNAVMSVSRRQFLGVGSAAVSATMIAAATPAAQIPQDTERAEHDRSRSSPLGPDDEALAFRRSCFCSAGSFSASSNRVLILSVLTRDKSVITVTSKSV